MQPASQPGVQHAVAASRLQPTPVLLIVTLLTVQAPAAASQSASCYRPILSTVGHRSKSVRIFLEKCHYFRNDDPYRHETITFLHIVVMRLVAKFRRRKTRRLGVDRPHRQNKQTLKYLVDVSHNSLMRTLSIFTALQ